MSVLHIWRVPEAAADCAGRGDLAGPSDAFHRAHWEERHEQFERLGQQLGQVGGDGVLLEEHFGRVEGCEEGDVEPLHLVRQLDLQVGPAVVEAPPLHVAQLHLALRQPRDLRSQAGALAAEVEAQRSLAPALVHRSAGSGRTGSCAVRQQGRVVVGLGGSWHGRRRHGLGVGACEGGR